MENFCNICNKYKIHSIMLVKCDECLIPNSHSCQISDINLIYLNHIKELKYLLNKKKFIKRLN